MSLQVDSSSSLNFHYTDLFKTNPVQQTCIHSMIPRARFNKQKCDHFLQSFCLFSIFFFFSQVLLKYVYGEYPVTAGWPDSSSTALCSSPSSACNLPDTIPEVMTSWRDNMPIPLGAMPENNISVSHGSPVLNSTPATAGRGFYKLDYSDKKACTFLQMTQ